MKKLLLIALLMLALVITAVACQPTPDEPDTSADDVTTAETPTEAPTDEPSTPAPETDPETPAPETDPETPAPETEPETPAPETDEPETPAPETEPETEPDPSEPVLMLDPEALNTLAGAAAPNVNQLGSTEIITEGGKTFVRWTAAGGDPYVAILPLGSSNTLPQYMAISYRTNSAVEGQFFVGSGAGWTGNGDSFMVTWTEGDWNFVIVDLTQTGVTSITDGLLTYARMDFFAGDSAEGDYFDVQYVGFFNTAEYAAAYDFEMNKAPMWNENQDVIKHQNFDQFYYGNGDQDDAVKNDLNLYHAVNKPEWDFVADMVGTEHTYVTYWGWVVLMSETVGQFGYQVGMGAPVFDNAWTVVAEQGVLDAAASQGGVTGTRMRIHINVADLEGENTVRVLYKDAEGNVVCLNEVTVIMPVKPTHYENYTVPQDQWVMTGHNTQLNDASNGMVAAGGVESAALLHQGSIALGEIDLSKYSKVVVMWGCDNSDVTVGRYNENANNRIMLLNAVMDGVMSPAEETIIAGGTYELKGWAVTAFEIDLTNVNYNGPVWLAIDALPGTFALFASVEFIGGEIDYSHQHSYETAVTAPTCTEAGFTTYTCACGDTYVADEVAALGHDIVTDAAVDATCTEAGLTAGEHCSRCDHKVAQTEVPALGHDMVTDTAKDATCTEAGQTAGEHCSRCDHKVGGEVIPALGHSHNEDGICSVCGDQIAVVPQVGKGYIFGMLQGKLNKVYYIKGGMDGYYMATTTDPAQALYVFIEETEGGYHFFCMENGVKKYINMVVSGTHVNGQYASAPTTVYRIDEASKTLIAVVNGSDYWFGTRNDKTYTTMGPCAVSYKGFYGEFYFAHSHEFVDGKCACGVELPHEHSYEAVVTAPTCTEEGYTTYTCECGDTYVDNKVDALGHTFVDGSCACGAADPNYEAHVHSYEAVVTAPTCTATGYTTYTCACGDTYTADETEVVPHVDANLDITCDFEGCTKRLIPAVDSEISLFTASHMIIVSLPGNYYMEGTVTQVLDAKNGNFVITDEAGDSVTVRLPKNADGITHANWEQKIVVGDVVRLYGQPKRDTNSNPPCAAMVQSAVLTILESHDHVFGEATCLDNGVCFCGKVGIPALGHTDEDASGLCDRCDWNMNLKVETVVTRTDDGSAVVNDAKTTSTWNGTEFSVTVDKSTGTMLYTTSKDHMRFYKQNDLVIASLNGKAMNTVTITFTAASHMTNFEKLLTGFTFTKDEGKFTITIEHNSAEDLLIKHSGTSTIQFKAFDIVYE